MTLLGIVVLAHPIISLLVEVLMIALQLLRLSYTVLSSETVILIKPLQPEKAKELIEVTLLGILMLVKPLQP